MTNKYEATGTIHAVMDTVTISETFRKREFALEIPDGNYSQFIKFQTVQDKTGLLDSVEIGQLVRVSFNLRGREYTRRSDGKTDYFVNLECWQIEPLEQNAQGHEPDNSQDSVDEDITDVPF